MTQTMPSEQTHALPSEIRSLMQQKQFSEAFNKLQSALKDTPDDAELVYLLTVCQRYAERYDDALESAKTLIHLQPAYGRAFQERGHIFSAVQQFAPAAQAYREAVNLNPALPASWRGLALALKSLGRDQEAEHALYQFDYLSKQPPVLVSAASLMHEGKLLKAETLCREFLKQKKHHPEAMRILALIGLELGILDDADFLLKSCVELYPDFVQARYDYIKVLRKRQKFAAAFAQAQALLNIHPDNKHAKIAYATQSAALGQYDDALAVYDELLAAEPNLHEIQLQRGHIFKTIGKADSANQAYQAAFTLKPDFGDAYWSLANMKTYQFNAQQIASMQAQEALPTTRIEDRYRLCFALGKAFEDNKTYDEAFHFYQRGNALKHSTSHYKIEKNHEDSEQQIEFFSPAQVEKLTALSADACLAKDPIFIVGLPRAGSTLLEQILASHSQVDGTLELSNILSLARKLGGGQQRSSERTGQAYPEMLAEISADELRQHGEHYIEDTRIHRQAAPFFIDKMPNNFRHIGLILSILPNAKIIDARRHPMACCFSGFKQLFAEGQEFTYGQEEIGHYYNDYVRLMDHWDTVYPGKILRVHYENVVEDLNSQVQRLLAYCNLPFEEACLEFHKTERAVRTASAEQVRQPIYQSGKEQWLNFAEYLTPLKQLLSTNINLYPQDLRRYR